MTDTNYEQLGVVIDGNDRNAAGILSSIADHERELLAIARLLVRQESDARDLVQDTFEAGIRHADDLRDPSHVRAWLIAIEVRAASRLRYRLKRFLPLDPDVHSGTTYIGEEVAALRAAVDRLPHRMRAAVVLHHMVGLSVAETAEAMGISANTTKWQLKEGLQRLREMLR